MTCKVNLTDRYLWMQRRRLPESVRPVAQMACFLLSYFIAEAIQVIKDDNLGDELHAFRAFMQYSSSCYSQQNLRVAAPTKQFLKV